MTSDIKRAAVIEFGPDKWAVPRNKKAEPFAAAFDRFSVTFPLNGTIDTLMVFRRYVNIFHEDLRVRLYRDHWNRTYIGLHANKPSAPVSSDAVAEVRGRSSPTSRTE